MDITTGLGLLAGATVVVTLMLMGGDLRMFFSDHAPLFPDDPYIAANRRVTITLMREAPPVPPDLRP